MVQLQSFAEMFGTKAGRGQKRSFILCNTFSRSPDEPNRFRAILFLKTPARSIAEHQAVFDGFPIKEMGIDMTCRGGNQSFHIPCTNRISNFADLTSIDAKSNETPSS